MMSDIVLLIGVLFLYSLTCFLFPILFFVLVFFLEDCGVDMSLFFLTDEEKLKIEDALDDLFNNLKWRK